MTNKKRNSLQLIFIAIFMLLVSIISTWACWHTNKVIIRNDGDFNLARINELAYAVVHHNNWFNLYSFNSGFIGNIGSALQNFYPNLMLWPWVLALLISHNYIFTFYAGSIFYLFISLMVSFLCYKKLNNQVYNSILFSILYNVGMGGLSFSAGLGQLGVFLGGILYPPVFLALYKMFIKHEYKYFYLLSIAMIFIVFSHLMTLYFILIAIISIYLISLIKQREYWQQNLISLLKAAGLTLSITGWWFIYLLKNLRYVDSVSKVQISQSVTSIHNIFLASFQYLVAFSSAGHSNPFWFIILILFLFYFKRAPRLYRYSYLLTILFFLMMTDTFPWHLIQNIPAVQTIQYAHRLIPPMAFFGSIAGTFLFSNMILNIYNTIGRLFNKSKNSTKRNYNPYIGYTILICIVLVTNIFSITNSLQFNRLRNNQFFVKTIKKDVDQIWNLDYYPKELHSDTAINHVMPQLNSSLHHLIIDPSDNNLSSIHMSKIEQSYNKANFTVTGNDHKQMVDLPILNFNNQYSLFVNGKLTPYYKSVRETIVFYMPAGKSRITLVTKPLLSQYALIIIALVSVGSLGYYKLFPYLKQRSSRQ